MDERKKLQLVVLAPNCDGTDVGEAWRAFKWVECLTNDCDITLLTLQRAGRTSVASQLPSVRVVTWQEPKVFNERLNAMLKPVYPYYFMKARNWLKNALARGEVYDVGHQITPAALRYPTPFIGLGIPYVLGPMAGSIETPEAFRSECGTAPLYTKLRNLDRLRFKFDPMLRRGFEEASAVIGVAPYVKALLADFRLKEIVLHSELAIDELATRSISSRKPGELRLLHVGRGVRTKGLRDVVRAMGQLHHLQGVTLDAAGEGEELEICRKEAETLGVSHRINFHGQVSRDRVEQLYARSDLFVFPSFREPSGRVISEAMRWGLPVLTVDRGGPGHVVDHSCGFLVRAETPSQLAGDLARQIESIAERPFWLVPMQAAAQRRVASEGLWSEKRKFMTQLYQRIVSENGLGVAA